jgi:hypothetical protein
MIVIASMYDLSLSSSDILLLLDSRAVVQERKVARMEHLQKLKEILASSGWSSVQVCSLPG